MKRNGDRGVRDAGGPREMSPYLACTAEFAEKNAFRKPGRVLAMYRELDWDPQPATLEIPKSGM